MFGVAAEERQALYAALGRGPDVVFPLRFTVDPSLSSGATAGRVDGFYRGSRDVQVEY
jgi:hypothetical protein